MKRHVRPKAKQAERLLTDLHALTPPPTTGDHLSDEAFVNYITETMTAEDLERADQHLATCPECSTQMEKLLTASQAWEGEQGTQHLAELRAQILAPPSTPHPPDLLEELRTFFASFSYRLAPAPSLVARAATELPPPLDFESRDRRLDLFVTETENGDVTLRFDASALELEGWEISVYAGKWERRAILSKAPEGDYVGAEVKLTIQEREALPPDTFLYVRLLDEA